MIAVWKRKKSDPFEEGYEYVSAELVMDSPGPDQVVPGFFYSKHSYLTKSQGFRDHEWDYMIKNSTNVRHDEPFF